LKHRTVSCFAKWKKHTANHLFVALYAERICEVKQMDELLQNIQDLTDEIASTIRRAIWVQIMIGNTLEDENDTDRHGDAD